MLFIKVDGPTSAPLTTSKPCVDAFYDCHLIVENNCHGFQDHCPRVSGTTSGHVKDNNTTVCRVADCARA